MKEFCVIIPAIKKNAIIPDQLVKRLNGETLIQRAINLSKAFTDEKDIYVISDSEEISLIAERNGVNYHLDRNLNVDTSYILKSLDFTFNELSKKYKFFILNRANAPLVDAEIISKAIEFYHENSNNLIVSVKKERRRIFETENGDLNSLFKDEKGSFYEEVNAFQIAKFDSLKKNETKTIPYVLPADKAIEIDGYQSWWICEKLLTRSKIVFNVIGSQTVGMGHIYRCLSIAHEITDHEIIFVCNEEHELVVDKIASKDYKVIACKKEEITDAIVKLKPSLVVNDILNSEKEDIKKLKENNIKVVNFEDLGEGSKYTDLTINELYDEAKLPGENYLWGHKYFFLREEFSEAKPHDIFEPVESLMITFGGTDQNNLSRHVLEALLPICQTRNIKIFVVCGSGYIHKESLESFIANQEYQNIEFTFSAGVISEIMEKTQLAICSNGRTTYELADMNIPSIVVSHHERESTHSFAVLERGFINLGVYNKGVTEELIKENFQKLVEDDSYRRLLFLNSKRYNFRSNKSKVINRILSLIEQ